MKRIAIILMLLMSASACLATGWHDYELDIGDGYTIFRANSFDLDISHDRRSLIGPNSFSEIGPVYGYCVTADFIFARAYGRNMRNLFEGDTFEDMRQASTTSRTSTAASEK